MDAIAGRPARAPIRAAGGLVARAAAPAEGRPQEQVLLVHRPRFDDWSLPKGKLKRGEHPLAAAVREVHEETTVWGVPGIRLPSVTYQVWSGESLVDKDVDWWAMTVAEVGRFTPTDEVDELAWVPVASALEMLTYERDRRVVRAYTELPALAHPVALLHHASAGPDPGSGPDPQRPLDQHGETQALALTPLLGLLRPERLVSAPTLRCRQTLAGLAETLALEIEVDTRFDGAADPDVAAAALHQFASDTATVVCSENPLIAAALARLSRRPPHPVPIGEALVLSFSGDRLVAADTLTPDASRPA